MKPLPAAALAALSFFATALPAQDVRRGIISYWPLDTTDGTTTPDLASGYNLSLVNMDLRNFAAGQRDLCATFNGVDELLARDTGAATPGLPLYNNPQFTICMWVKGTGTAQANDRRIWAESSSTAQNPIYNIGTFNGANVADIFVRNDTAASVNHLRTVQTPLNGTWHHLALTDNAGSIKVYVDGVLDSVVVNYSRGILTADRLAIGALRRAADGNWFNGQVDDVAVWSRVLTQPEIQDVMNNGITTPIPPLVSVVPAGPYTEGDRVELAVRAYGAGPFTYQWRRGGTDIATATNSTLLIPALTAATAGAYDVLVNGAPTTGTVLTYTADPPVALSTGIVSWWPGDTIDTVAVPPTTPDPWGGNALTCEAMDLTNLVPGQFDLALQFNGAQRAYRTTGFPVSNNPAYSVAFWVKGDGTSQVDLRAFAESSNTTNTPIFTLGTATPASASLRVYIRSDLNVVSLAALSTAPVFDNTWHHVAWVDNNGAGKLYVDGMLDATPMRYTRTGQTYTFNQTTLGAITRAAVGSWFTGAMDDTAVWNRALTWTEIQQLRLSGVPDPVADVPAEITADPVSRTVWQGRPVTLSVQAIGTAPLAFQWFRGPDLIQNATSPDYIFPSAQPADSGSYTCRVTNTAGTDISAAAQLTVLPITGLSSGLLSCWGMDTATTTTPDRISGFDFTLQNMDPATALVPARVGNGLLFDGVDDLLVRTRTGTGNDVPVSSLPEFTVSFWVNGIGTGQSDRRIFSESSNVNANPLFNIGTEAVGATNAISLFIRDDAGTTRSNHPVSNAQPLDGAWHHVVWSDNNGQAQLYIDGAADIPVTYARSVKTLTSTTAGGILRGTASHWFAGSVDELCTWSRAITADEALDLYLMGVDDPLTVTDTFLQGGNLRLIVRTKIGEHAWQVQETENPGTGPWGPVSNVTFSTVVDGRFTADFAAPAPGTRRFFRVIAP